MSRDFDGKCETDSESFRSLKRDFSWLGKVINITEDVRKYAAEPSGANRSLREDSLAIFGQHNRGKSIFRRKTRRASGKASQQGLAEEEALQKSLAEKSAEYRFIREVCVNLTAGKLTQTSRMNPENKSLKESKQPLRRT